MKPGPVAAASTLVVKVGSSLVTNWMLVALLLRVSAAPGRSGGAA